MKIRELSDYIKQKTNSDIEYNTQLKLLTKADLLLTKLYGEFDDPEGFLKGELTKLSSFAEDSDDQVFYEFLQNAKDANGSGLWVFMDQKLGVIILNDGEPFHTNPDITDGSLFSFLGKGKGGKFKDSTKSGEKGMGSKLMYNMLVPYNSSGNLSGMSERLAEALSEDQTGPILFSWSKQDINALRRILNVNDLSGIQTEGSENPILCKLFLSYFPALPNQSLNYLGKDVIPFGQLEFNQFKNCLSEALKFFKSDELFYSPGSILYIPAHESTIQKLEGGLEEICKGLAQSLSVLSIDGSLNKLKRVIFGDKKIEKEEFQFIPITVQNDGIAINASIVFSLTRNEKQKSLPNIFTDYFPISKEIHGLGYILRCKKFNILDNRQKLRKNESNKFTAFANKLIESWSQIPDSSYSPFLGSLAISHDPEEGEEILLFHEIVKAYAINQIPTSYPDIPRVKADEVIALPTGFEKMNISELLVGKYPLHPSLYEYYNDGLDNWGIESYSLSRVFHEAGVEKSKEFFQDSKEYLKLVQQIEFENETDNLYEIPFIPTFTGYLSIKEFCEEENTFLFFPQNQFGSFRKQCEKENVQIKFSSGVNDFLELSYYPNIKSLIESNWDSDKIFERITEFFESEEIVFSQDLREQIFNSLYSYDRDKFSEWIKDEAPYFSNRKGDNGLLIGETIGGASGSDFYSDWNLPLKEELSFLKSFQAEKDATWGIISSDRSFLSTKTQDLEISNLTKSEKDAEKKKILSDRTHLTNKMQQLESSELIKSVLSQLVNSFQNWANKKPDDVYFDSKDKLAFTYDEVWGDFEKTIFHKGFIDLSVVEYDAASKLFSKFGYLIPNFDLLAVYNSREFQKLFQVKSLDGLNLNWIPVSIEEVELLKRLSDAEDASFFKVFNLKEKGIRSIEIKSNANSSCQFFNSPIEVSAFLNDQEGYFELPDSLISKFTLKDGLFDVSSESFKNILLEKFGSERSFLGLFQKASYELKIAYIQSLDSIEIKSDDQEVLDEKSFEVSLVKAFANDESQLSILKEKIQIDGQTISHDGYNDSVKINSHSYILSELLDDHEGALDRMSKATKLFSALNWSIREKFLGLKDKPLSDIKDEILVVDKGKPVHAAFLIDYLEQVKIEESELSLDDLPNFLEINIHDLFSEFKERDVNWKKYWDNCWFDFDPKTQIIPTQDECWLDSEAIPQTLLEWVRESESNSKYFADKLSNQNHVLNSEQFRSSLTQGEVLEKIYLPNNMRARAFDWIISKEVNLIENEGKKLWGILENQGLWEKYLLSYISWGDRDERIVRLKNVSSSIKYYFDSTSHFEYLKMSELVPDSVTILNTSSSSKRREIARKLNLEKLVIEISPEGGLPEKEEWEVGYYHEWKDNRGLNNFTYRIYTVDQAIKSSAVVMKGSEIFLKVISIKNETLLRIHNRENKHNDIYIHLENNVSLSLKYLGEFQNKIFEGEKESNDLVRLFSIANEFNEEALTNLKTKGIIDENFNPLRSANNNGSSSNSKGNVYLEGFENLPNPNLLLDNWELLKQLIDKFGNDVGKKLQEALENETDDSKPNKLSGFIGEQLAREWFEKNYQKEAFWIGYKYLPYDIIIETIVIEIKTKIDTLYDDSLGGSGTTPVYLRKSQLSFIEEEEKEYYLGLISLEDLGVNGNYYEWLEVWGREEDIQFELQEEIKVFAKNFLNQKLNLDLFSESIRFIFLKNGKEQISVLK